MPRQVRFTKETIIKVSLEIIREEGPEALTSRHIASKAGCSVGPIFREYLTMKELVVDVRKAAEAIFLDYVDDVSRYEPAYKEFGIRVVRFSREDPNLFRFLFMQDDGSQTIVEKKAWEYLSQTENAFGLTEQQARYIFSINWPFFSGLAILCQKAPEIFTDDYVSQMLSAQFQSLLMLVKSGREVLDIKPKLKQQCK